MSNSIDSDYESSVGGWLALLIMGAVVYGIFTFCGGWSLLELFNKSNNTEKWIEAKWNLGTYPPSFDDKWVSSIFDNIKVQCKFRGPILDGTNDKMDFAYEATAILTRPDLEKEKKDELNYWVNLIIMFVDEDGFILDEINTMKGVPTYIHEKHKQTYLKHNWDGPESENVTVKVLLNNRIQSNVAKKTKKIVFKAEIKIAKYEKDAWYELVD